MLRLGHILGVDLNLFSGLLRRLPQQLLLLCPFHDARQRHITRCVEAWEDGHRLRQGIAAILPRLNYNGSNNGSVEGERRVR